MSTIIAPPAGLLRPVLLNLYGIPEVFADGGICSSGEVLSETILYRRYGSERHAIMRIIVPRQSSPEDGHDVSIIRAYLDAMGCGPRH